MTEKNESVVEIVSRPPLVVVEMVISVSELEALIEDSGTVSMSVDDDGRVNVRMLPYSVGLPDELS